MPTVSMSFGVPTPCALHPFGAFGGGALLNASWSGWKMVVVGAMVRLAVLAAVSNLTSEIPVATNNKNSKT